MDKKSSKKFIIDYQDLPARLREYDVMYRFIMAVAYADPESFDTLQLIEAARVLIEALDTPE